MKKVSMCIPFAVTFGPPCICPDVPSKWHHKRYKCTCRNVQKHLHRRRDNAYNLFSAVLAVAIGPNDYIKLESTGIIPVLKPSRNNVNNR